LCIKVGWWNNSISNYVPLQTWICVAKLREKISSSYLPHISNDFYLLKADLYRTLWESPRRTFIKLSHATSWTYKREFIFWSPVQNKMRVVAVCMTKNCCWIVYLCQIYNWNVCCSASTIIKQIKNYWLEIIITISINDISVLSHVLQYVIYQTVNKLRHPLFSKIQICSRLGYSKHCCYLDAAGDAFFLV